MKLKLLLLMLVMSAGLVAQDTIRTLIISEARIDRADMFYVELTNVGDTDLDLMDWEVGRITAWRPPYDPNPGESMIIGEYLSKYMPEKSTILPAGESFVIASVEDFSTEQNARNPIDYPNEVTSKVEFLELADIQLHRPETDGGPGTSDSISPENLYNICLTWNGRDCMYLRYHFLDVNSQPDSVVTDQVNGWFDEANGTNYQRAYPCAGVVDASYNTTLIRKFSVTKGNTDYATASGLDLADSEWMPIEHLRANTEWEAALFWTVGNHNDYNLDADSFKDSDNEVDIDWTNKIITVPWGVRNRDSVMKKFDYHPGLAWHYDYAHTHEDSAFLSARTGDSLTVYAAGLDLDIEKFRIEVAAPTDDANIVIPKSRKNDDGFYVYNNAGVGFVYDVTDGMPGMDSILDVPFAERTDTLFKYLEKAPEASWEIEWVDDTERPDLKDGDILLVTAKDGTEKRYYISVEDFVPSHNSDLSAITWPDVPELYKLTGIYGWEGDTIPGFAPKKLNYRVTVKNDVDGIPGLVAKTDHLGAKVKVTRARNLFGTVQDKTTSFEVTAEDDTTISNYNVEIARATLEENIQPWEAIPFISEFCFRDQFANSFMEICNPGTVQLDLSYFMFYAGSSNDPVAAITSQNESAEDWAVRYTKYIPGRKWKSEADWIENGRVAEDDPAVNELVNPGDVFVMAHTRAYPQSGYPWWASAETDIDFWHDPWDENYGDGTPANAVPTWHTGHNFYMWRILNDSVRNGTKAVYDPEDFELIETWGPGDGTRWVIPDDYQVPQVVTFRRKPNVYSPKKGFKESWGTTREDSEWEYYDQAWGSANNLGWPMRRLFVTEDIGKHFMNEVTIYRSTVSSVAYKVTEGYSMDEEIRGLVEGITVEQFMPAIIKVHPDQVLTVISTVTGDTLTGTDVITHGDSLVVLAANGQYTSQYHLEVTAGGLSDDAVLTSTEYTIDPEAGTITGIDYGTSLETVLNNVTKPAGSLLNIIDEEDKYVSLVQLNFDTSYVDVMVSDQIFFEVVAEDGVTTITYQLIPTSSPSDAFVLSNVYTVDQDALLIQFVPEGTTVGAFYSNLTPASGAEMQVKDKAGFDRNMGYIYLDDKLVVTSADGSVEVTYYLAMLEQEVNYLAYVLSSSYVIDQVALTIDGSTDVNESTLVSDFLANLDPAPGASMVVLDSEMTEKDPSDDMDVGDILMVTAGNGVTVVYYDILVDPTSVEGKLESALNVYPNPSTGLINISGLEYGSRINVYNALGAQVIDNFVVDESMQLHLEGQQKGLYFMIISKDEMVLGQYKLIIE